MFKIARVRSGFEVDSNLLGLLQILLEMKNVSSPIQSVVMESNRTVYLAGVKPSLTSTSTSGSLSLSHTHLNKADKGKRAWDRG